jgi:hypothetical protein
MRFALPRRCGFAPLNDSPIQPQSLSDRFLPVRLPETTAPLNAVARTTTGIAP